MAKRPLHYYNAFPAGIDPNASVRGRLGGTACSATLGWHATVESKGGPTHRPWPAIYAVLFLPWNQHQILETWGFTPKKVITLFARKNTTRVSCHSARSHAWEASGATNREEAKQGIIMFCKYRQLTPALDHWRWADKTGQA